ncbi:acetyl-CoA carboxylase biotin carboxylase subunit family protein [Enterobacteriaceae bacterium LUAb1]
MIKPQAILFVDIDDSPIEHYSYREPHFIAARARGLICLTVALRTRNHIDRLHASSDQLFLLDTLTFDSLHKLISKTISLQYHLQAVFCHSGHASELGQMGCIVADLCHALGLQHASAPAIDACNNKFMMRQLLDKAGVRNIRYALCHSIDELAVKAQQTGFPLIAKPPFGALSAFIKKCHNLDELREHYHTFNHHFNQSQAASFLGSTRVPDEEHNPVINIPGQTLLLEEYIEGTEGCIECILTQNGCYPLIISEKLLLTEKKNTVLENLLLSPPCTFSVQQQQEIRQYARDCLQATGLTHAFAHLEFRMTPQGPVIIEINPRLGGLYVNSAFRDMLALDPYQTYLSILLADPALDSQLEKSQQMLLENKTSYSMMAIYPEKNGIFKGLNNIDFVKENPSIIEYGVYPDNQYVNAEIEEHYLLKCWAKTENKQQAISLYNEITDQVLPVID